MRREYRYLVAALALWVFSQQARALAAPDAGGVAQTSNAAAAADSAEKIQLGESAVELTGPWRFHIGDDMAWTQPGFDDSTWETMDSSCTARLKRRSARLDRSRARGLLGLRMVSAKGRR